MANRLPRDEERRLADGLRAAIEAYEERQRAALAALRNDLQAALWPADENANDIAQRPAVGRNDEEGTRYG